MKRESLPLRASCAVCLLGASLLAPTALYADSGIRKGSFELVSGPTTPPPDQTVTTTWSIDISNVNDVCDERVLVLQKNPIVNDPANRDLPLIQRSGRSKFEGFKLTANGPLTMTISEEMEDEKCPGCARPPLTVFFDITTGEDLLGCDFKGAEQTLAIRDTGLFCWSCCDSADELPAEPPTEFNPKLSINAATTSGTGTGTIYGWVSRTGPLGMVRGQQTEVNANKIGTCVQGAPDNLDTCCDPVDSNGGLPLKLPTDRGCYVFENIPFGSYVVRAIADGSFFVEANINVVSSAPVEVNICDGPSSSCPSNPACVP